MAAFCVGSVCVSVEQFPDARDVASARDEDARRQQTEAIRARLTLPPHVGPFRRLPPLKPGQLPS